MCLIRFRNIESPVGPLTLAGHGDLLTHLVLGTSAHPPHDRASWVEDPGAFSDAVAQLHDYFAGTRTCFDVPLSPPGTDFQRRVWDALCEIPYAETRSYAEIARRIDRPGAARAVGSANARNPIAIVVPCHRVIGTDGSLTGYGGGLPTKRALLDLEQAGAGQARTRTVQ